MDIDALFDREVAYYQDRPVVVWIPTTSEELTTSILTTKTETGVKTTITAPYTPTNTKTIEELQVLNKPVGAPVSYMGTFTTIDTATLIPVPVFPLNHKVKIGENIYRVVQITGDVVKFERAVSELMVFVAQPIAEDVTYQWQILDFGVWVNIPGATERTYEPVAGDVGKDLRVLVTYTNGQGVVIEDLTPTPSIVPNQQYQIIPIYPKIAEISLDVARSYTQNSINKFVIEVESLS